MTGTQPSFDAGRFMGDALRGWLCERLPAKHPVHNSEEWRLFSPPLPDGITRGLILTLLRRVLLHLPRLHAVDLQTPELLQREIARQYEALQTSRICGPSWSGSNAGRILVYSDAHLEVIDAEIARIAHEQYHYLGHFRRRGIHLGLIDQPAETGALLCQITLAELDIPHLADAIKGRVSPSEVMILSRLVCFEWTPRNTASFAIGRLFAWLRSKRPDIRLVLTYLDPNAGLAGTIYRASNWRLFAFETKRRYLYVDRDYVTERAARIRFGTSDIRVLKGVLGDRLEVSTLPLQPLEIYMYALDSSLTDGWSSPLQLEPVQ